MLFRGFAYHVLTLLLFVFLILTAWSTALSVTFSKPAKLEGWLNQSKLYGHFVENALEQSQKSLQNAQPAGATNGTSLDIHDPAVQNAAKAAITPEVLQKSVNTFLDSNYAWLQGKTAKPDFTIDLTGVKSAMAANLGAYAQQRAAALPRCTNLIQAAQQTNPLTATCLPPGVTGASAAQLVEQQVADSQDFLANPVITADSISPTGQTGSQTGKPYYQQFSQLPAAYRFTIKLPWLVGALSVLCALGMILLAAPRRKGFRRIASLLVSTGIIILILTFLSNALLHQVANRLATGSKVGQLQQSVVDVAHHAQSSLAGVEIWFGIGFILGGLAVYAYLYFTRPKLPHTVAPGTGNEPPAPQPPQPKRPTLIQL